MCHAHQTLKHRSAKTPLIFCNLQCCLSFVTTAKHSSLCIAVVIVTIQTLVSFTLEMTCRRLWSIIFDLAPPHHSASFVQIACNRHPISPATPSTNLLSQGQSLVLWHQIIFFARTYFLHVFALAGSKCNMWLSISFLICITQSKASSSSLHACEIQLYNFVDTLVIVRFFPPSNFWFNTVAMRINISPWHMTSSSSWALGLP